MALDAYQPCPCGSGSKVKFCCSKDIVHELGEIERALEGEQRLAALNQIEALLAAKGPRAALLTLKAELKMQLGEPADAQPAVEQLLEQQPQNPVALSLSAMVLASQDDLDGAVIQLQRGMAHVDETIPYTLYEAIGMVGNLMLAKGNVLGGHSHLLLQASLDQGEDQRAMRLLARLHASPQIPLLLKQDFELDAGDGAGGGEFDEAFLRATHGAWLVAVEKFLQLSARVPASAAILKNIAILRSWLGDTPAAVQAWRAYASLPGVALEDAVEAEALAQLLDPGSKNEPIDVVTVTHTVNDPEQLFERLRVEPRAQKMPVAPSQLAPDDGSAPPKAAYWLLDKPVPPTSTGLTRETAPNVLGELYAFGKQTTRAARLEFVVTRTGDFEAKKAVLRDVLGAAVSAAAEEKVTSDVDGLASALTWNWRLPDGTPPDVRQNLIAEQRRDMIEQKWSALKLRVLDDKSPREASGDPAYRIRLLAAILLLEQNSHAQLTDVYDFNDLRRQLGLPTCDEIDPAGVDVQRLPLVRLRRLTVGKLADSDLVVSYQRAGQMGALAALGPLAKEVVRRDSLEGQVNKTEAYELLGQLERDNEQAIRYVKQATKCAVDAGHSPAHGLLTELRLRLDRGLSEEIPALIRQIQTRHGNEPGVGQGLYELLVGYGLISPERTAAGSAPRPAAAAQASKIWTPDAPAAAAAGEKKSKLWLPGMD